MSGNEPAPKPFKPAIDPATGRLVPMTPEEEERWIAERALRSVAKIGEIVGTPEEEAAADEAQGTGVNAAMKAVMTLEMAPELNDAIANLAEELGVPKGEAILKGIRLLTIALEAKREGKRLAILDDRDDTEQEITGL